MTIPCKVATIFFSLDNFSATVHLLLVFLKSEVDLSIGGCGVGEESGCAFWGQSERKRDKGSGGDDNGNIGKTPWNRDQKGED